MGLYKGKNMSTSQKVTWTIVSIFFGILSLSYLTILLWGFMSGGKTHSEIINDPFALPKTWKFENYTDAFSRLKVGRTNFFGMLVNSIWYSVGGAVANVTCQACLAYISCKYKFKGSWLIYAICMVTMIMPIYGSAGSMYRLVYGLGINDSPLIIVSAMSGIGMGFLMFHAFFENLSWAYAEAALIDGANHFTIFFRIMFPQCVGLYGSLLLMQWLVGWNDYQSPLLYLTKMPTLASGLEEFRKETIQDQSRHILIAGLMMSSIPALILFATFSNSLLKNMSLGGLKG